MEIRNPLCWGCSHAGSVWAAHRPPEWHHSYLYWMSSVEPGLEVMVGIGELEGRFQLSSNNGLGISDSISR